MPLVRRATARDLPRLLPMIAEYWRFEGLGGFSEPRVAEPLARLLGARDLGEAWLALDGETPVGYLLAVFVFSLEHAGLTAEIDEFHVAATARGAGIGAALLAAAESEFRRRGCTHVSLQLGTGNERARAFYHRHGYRERSGFELLEKRLPPH